MRQRSAEAAAKLGRLYGAIEDGLMSTADAGLKDRLAELAAIRDDARGEADRAEAAIEKLGPIITAEGIERFAEAARQRMRDTDGSYRRAHIRAVAQRVEVISTKEIKIMGSRTELLRTLAAAGGVQTATFGVRSLKPKWRARSDSNARPSDS